MFFHNPHAHSAAVSVEPVSNNVGMSMKVNHHLLDPGLVAYFQPYLQHRYATDWDQTFGDCIGDRPQPRPVAGRQKEGLHNNLRTLALLVTLTPRTTKPPRKSAERPSANLRAHL